MVEKVETFWVSLAERATQRLDRTRFGRILSGRTLFGRNPTTHAFVFSGFGIGIVIALIVILIVITIVVVIATVV